MSRHTGTRNAATLRALRALRDGPRTSQGVAAYAGHESTSQQRRALESLERQGLVVRAGSAWALTDAGRAVIWGTLEVGP